MLLFCCFVNLLFCHYVLCVFISDFVSRTILREEYNRWTTVFKQLYFATFTISFFALSAIGLAYLEKSVNPEQLLTLEYRGRMLIGLLLVLTVLAHQFIDITPERYDEWEFTHTTWGYFVVLAFSIAAHFPLIPIFQQLEAQINEKRESSQVDLSEVVTQEKRGSSQVVIANA